MNTFFALLKVDLLRLFGINKAFKSGKGGRKILGIVALLLMFGILVIVESAGMTFGMASLLPAGERYIALAFVLILYFVLMLSMTVGTSKVLFGSSDFDLLMSLPVKPTEVILSKIAYVYLIDYLFSLAFIMPSSIICGVIEGSVLVYSLCGLLYSFFLPLIPMSIGLGLGTLVHYLISRIRNKTLLGIIASSIFIVVYIYFVFGSNNIDNSKINAVFSLPLFAPVRFIASGVSGNLVALAVFILASSSLCALVIWLISKNYFKINQAISARVGGGSFIMTEQEAKTPAKTLFVRELKLFFSSSTNIMNTMLGAVVVIALGIMFIVKGGINGAFMEEGVPPEDYAKSLAIISGMLLSAFPFFSVVVISVNTYASYAISLEGKRLWVLKSLPVLAKDILRAKIAVALLLSCPFAVIGTILFGIGLNASVLDIIFACLIVCAYTVCDVVISLNVNMKYNFFDWKSEAEVVKRGTSVLICMLIGMLGAVVLGVIQIVSSLFLSHYVGWGITLALLVGLIILFGSILFKDADNKFRRLGEN